MNLLKFINVPVFIVSLALGIFFVYITTSAKRTIIVYPTHENANLLQYRDATQNCFSVIEKEVSCPSDPSKISKIPAQS
jgi:hypothetical protein